MGFLDKIKGLANKIQQRPLEEVHEDIHPSVTLNVDHEDEWAVQMIVASGLDATFKTLLSDVEETKKKLEESVGAFSDESKLTGIPERARTVNAVHGNELVQQTQKLVEKAVFTDMFMFDDEQHTFQLALDEFRSNTGKNVAALKEFMEENVTAVLDSVKELEDASVGFLQEMENRNFPQIVRVHEALEEMKKINEKQEKFRSLLGQLTERLQAIRQKQEKINDKITEQRKLIRNPTALQALDDLTGLENELDEITRQHEHASSDAMNYYKKNRELSIPTETHDVLQELPRHPSSYVAEHPEEIAIAFGVLAEQLEQEGRGNLGNLIQRLHDLSQTARKDSARAAEILPKQSKLKQQIMRDVAAINIYDQQQFLMRANRDEKELEAKQTFVKDQLSSGSKIGVERELKDAAHAFGAQIEGDSLEEVQYPPEVLDETPEPQKEEIPAEEHKEEPEPEEEPVVGPETPKEEPEEEQHPEEPSVKPKTPEEEPEETPELEEEPEEEQVPEETPEKTTEPEETPKEEEPTTDREDEPEETEEPTLAEEPVETEDVEEKPEEIPKPEEETPEPEEEPTPEVKDLEKESEKTAETEDLEEETPEEEKPKEETVQELEELEQVEETEEVTEEPAEEQETSEETPKEEVEEEEPTPKDPEPDIQEKTETLEEDLADISFEEDQETLEEELKEEETPENESEGDDERKDVQ